MRAGWACADVRACASCAAARWASSRGLGLHTPAARCGVESDGRGEARRARDCARRCGAGAAAEDRPVGVRACIIEAEDEHAVLFVAEERGEHLGHHFPCAAAREDAVHAHAGGQRAMRGRLDTHGGDGGDVGNAKPRRAAAARGAGAGAAPGARSSKKKEGSGPVGIIREGTSVRRESGPEQRHDWVANDRSGRQKTRPCARRAR